MTYIPPQVPAHLQERTRLLLEDRDSFVRLLRIKNKQTQKFEPFTPNEAQQKLLELLDVNTRVIVIKARQVGVSTAVRAWQFQRAFISADPLNFAVLSFHDRSAKNLRRMDRRWLNELPSLLKRELSVDSAEDTVFVTTLAGFSSFTTGGRGGTRSFEFSGGHLSEFAFYTDADEVLAQSMSTVGDGPLVIESTVNAPGDAFHRLIEGAPENGWTVFTYWWHEHAPYRDDNIPDDWVCTDEEIDLAAKHNLDDAQLYWRRQMIGTLGINKFKREYPACIDYAFLSRDSTYFSAADIEAIQEVWFDTEKREFEKPMEGTHYVVGSDVGGGVGGDYSSLVVVSLATLQPVYIERNNQVPPHEWAMRLALVGKRYNDALVLCESNNHGHVVTRELDRIHYYKVWRDANGKPWTTTVKSKLEAFDCLREHIRSRIIFALDQTTRMELRGLEIRKVTPEAPPGLHDDLAVALALAYRCVRSTPPSQRRADLGARMSDFISKQRARQIKRQTLPWSRNQ